tara:strand:- start:338 stop:496 length:159 start_codon:yes stop_codon:yes gene_type:complete
MSKGIGDTIERITKLTGIKYIVEKSSGKKGCNCEERKKRLNELFPYKENKNV